MCPIVAAYATECASQGVIIEWRNEVKECAVKCPAGQMYHTCADSCTRSCSDIMLADAKLCKTKCVEGCNCPQDQTLNEYGECIPIGECPCQNSGIEFPSGFKEIRPGRRSEEVW